VYLPGRASQESTSSERKASGAWLILGNWDLCRLGDSIPALRPLRRFGFTGAATGGLMFRPCRI